MTVEQIIYNALTTGISTQAKVFYIAAPLGTKLPFVRFDSAITGVEYVKGATGLEPIVDHNTLTIDAVAVSPLTAAALRDKARECLEGKTFEQGNIVISDVEVSTSDIKWNDDVQGFDCQIILSYDSEVQEVENTNNIN